MCSEMNDKATMIVVDDDLDMIEQLSAIFRSDGYNVFSAASQQEAEELLLTVRPDVAILDLMMDQMDSGFVLCHYLKKLYPETPVILLTAVTGTTGLSFAASSPEAQSWVKADKVMDKPVRQEQIKAEVRRLLQRAGENAAKERTS
jgi:CheY-like chemotaxis protein